MALDPAVLGASADPALQHLDPKLITPETLTTPKPETLNPKP